MGLLRQAVQSQPAWGPELRVRAGNPNSLGRFRVRVATLILQEAGALAPAQAVCYVLGFSP